jgi:phosphoserine phosphatase
VVEIMEPGRPEPLTLAATEIAGRIRAARAAERDGVLAFDGDGTLWSGDVGEDVFHYAVSRQLLREAAEQALASEAARHGIDTSGSASALAERLFKAYLAGKYPERDVCAMMTWCYAGFSVTELDLVIEHAFEEKKLATRLTRELEPVLAFARSESLRVIVVSASPQPIVERAARLWSLPPGDIAACPPAVAGDRLLPYLAAPVPYAEAKVSALTALAAAHPLLASFGDNVFDIELLRAARVPVAVRPKPALRARLTEVPGVVLLHVEPAPAAIATR